MRKLSFARFFMLVCLVSFAQLAQGVPNEWVSIPVKNGKKPRFTKNFDYGPVRLRRLVFEGETADDWTEGLEMIIGQKSVYPPTVSEMFGELMEKRKSNCPGMRCDILEEKPDSMLYEIRSDQCGDYPAEYSITRIIFTAQYVHMAIYNNRNLDSVDIYREEWIDRLSTLKIITRP